MTDTDPKAPLVKHIDDVLTYGFADYDRSDYFPIPTNSELRPLLEDLRQFVVKSIIERDALRAALEEIWQVAVSVDPSIPGGCSDNAARGWIEVHAREALSDTPEDK